MNRGHSLIGVLAAAAIVLLLAVIFIWANPFGSDRGPQRADKEDRTIVSGSRARANDAVCMSNLKQVRYAIEIIKMNEGAPPPSLQAVGSIPREMWKCPIGGEPYVYDPSTGAVRCVHPGHEGY
jgi:hypothetical protein